MIVHEGARYSRRWHRQWGGLRPARGARRFLEQSTNQRPLRVPQPQPSRQSQQQSGVSCGACVPHPHELFCTLRCPTGNACRSRSARRGESAVDGAGRSRPHPWRRAPQASGAYKIRGASRAPAPRRLTSGSRLLEPAPEQAPDLGHANTRVLVLAVAQPAPCMGKAQVEPQAPECGICRSQRREPRGATMALCLEQGLLKVEGGVDQALRAANAAEPVSRRSSSSWPIGSSNSSTSCESTRTSPVGTLIFASTSRSVARSARLPFGIVWCTMRSAT